MSQPMQQQPTSPLPWPEDFAASQLSTALEKVGFKPEALYMFVPVRPGEETILAAMAYWKTKSGTTVIQCITSIGGDKAESFLYWPIAAADIESQLASIVDRMGPNLSDLPIWQVGDTSADHDTMLDPAAAPSNYKAGNYRPGE